MLALLLLSLYTFAYVYVCHPDCPQFAYIQHVKYFDLFEILSSYPCAYSNVFLPTVPLLQEFKFMRIYLFVELNEHSPKKQLNKYVSCKKYYMNQLPETG